MKACQSSLVFALCSLLLVGVTACEFSTQQPEPTLIPSFSTSTPLGINITKEEYEQALVKWRSQAIEEYEIKVRYTAYSSLMGIWTLHVKSAGDDAEVLDYVRESGLEAPEGGVGSHNQMPTDEEGINYLKEQLEYLTIEGQFKSINHVFSKEWQGLREVNVRFDPEFGYPSDVNFLPSPRVSELSRWSRIGFKVIREASSKTLVR